MPLEAAKRLPPSLALGSPAGKVGPRWRVKTCLVDGYAVQGEVELTVATAVEPMATLAPRGGVKRRNAGEHRKLGVSSKALHAGHLGDQLGRRQSPTARKSKQVRSMLLEQRPKLTLEPPLLAQKLLGPAGELAAKPRSQPVVAPKPALKALEPDRTRKRGNLEVWIEVVQVPAQAVVIGAVLMLQGIGFISVVAASVTAALIEQARNGRTDPVQPDPSRQLERIDTRLAAIERTLANSRDRPGGASGAPPNR
jgi:hypothetical protein